MTTTQTTQTGAGNGGGTGTGGAGAGKGKFSDEEIRRRSEQAFDEGRRGVPPKPPTDPVDDDADGGADDVDDATTPAGNKRTRRRKSDTAEDVDDEVKVLSACSRELGRLSPEARSRVLLYLARRHEPAQPRYAATAVTIDAAPRAAHGATTSEHDE